MAAKKKVQVAETFTGMEWNKINEREWKSKTDQGWVLVVRMVGGASNVVWGAHNSLPGVYSTYLGSEKTAEEAKALAETGEIKPANRIQVAPLTAADTAPTSEAPKKAPKPKPPAPKAPAGEKGGKPAPKAEKAGRKEAVLKVAEIVRKGGKNGCHWMDIIRGYGSPCRSLVVGAIDAGLIKQIGRGHYVAT